MSFLSFLLTIAAGSALVQAGPLASAAVRSSSVHGFQAAVTAAPISSLVRAEHYVSHSQSRLDLSTVDDAALVHYPCTSTNTQNSAVTAYESCASAGTFQGSFAGSSTIVRTGLAMTVQMAPTSKAYVGTLTNWPLYTTISSALNAACLPTLAARENRGNANAGIPKQPPHVGSGGKLDTSRDIRNWTSCAEVPEITGIVYAKNAIYGSGKDWHDNGKLNIKITEISFTDRQSLNSLISTVAAALNASSMNSDSWDQPGGGYCTGLHTQSNDCPVSDIWAGPNCVNTTIMDGFGRSTLPVAPFPPDVANVPATVFAALSMDTSENPAYQEQFIRIELTTEEGSADPFKCAYGALFMDALAVLPALPGLDALSFLAWPALTVSASCAIDEAKKGGE